ncbi:nitroreductase [Acinetobacter sp. ANC 4558]|uniref:nitroreductase family protein n=1 Tax=Acinetobacter sp. ANC 4558 TaxID=1977876 RepID=UPI000A32EB3A|nr:nitroreductase family protein [Acinetobacter sp. ANC 4558]OTG85295.1 nitroreductase [Acinetobacter sp. ANC 4558]
MVDSVSDIVHHNIHQRQSIGHLVEPAPNDDQLEQAFLAALAAPDHHRLNPTRFVIIPADQRDAFGTLLSQALADTGQTEAVQLERVKNHPYRAPLLVLALTQFVDHPKVPYFEQTLSTGAAIQNFLLSLQAQGFSTIWRSGAVVESQHFKHILALTEHDLISGIIYIGTAVKEIPPRAQIDTHKFVSYWNK